jgi:hypothetical protein
MLDTVRCMHIGCFTDNVASATVLLQQNHNICETEGDVLEEVNAVEGSPRTLCTKHKELVAPATTASKGATLPGGMAECAEPVAEQQQQQRLRPEDADDKLHERKERLPLRASELAAVHRVVTGAITGNTGATHAKRHSSTYAE